MSRNNLYPQKEFFQLSRHEWAGQIARRPSKAVPLKRGRAPQLAITKVAVNIRLSRRVVAHFKQGGRGWQRRIDETLCYFVTIAERRQRRLQPWPRSIPR